MCSPADPFSILNKDPNRGKILPKKNTKINRMWPGKAPDWVKQNEIPEEKAENPVNEPAKKRQKFETEIVVECSPPKIEAEIIKEMPLEDNEREILKRLALENEGEEEPDAFADIPDEAEPILQPCPNESDYIQNDPQDDDSQSSSEMEEEPEVIAPLLKPAFIEKEARSTQKRREEELLREAKRIEEAKKRREEFRLETKMMVIRSIKEDQEKPKNMEDTEEGKNMPTDDDDINEEYEYEQWKIRELKRIKRDKEEREKFSKEKQEIERRRNLTDAQREEENKRLGTDETEKKKKAKYQFMEKYYHQGAYFQEKAREDKSHIYNRDYNLPTQEDAWDKSALPKILQKRRGDFGKKGNAKWTHLSAEDTTDFNPAWKVPEKIHNKVLQKSAAFKAMNSFNRPSRKSYK